MAAHVYRPSALQTAAAEFLRTVAPLLGLSPSAAAVFAVCLASPVPLTFSEIHRRLDLSAGSVSQGIKFLRRAGALIVVPTTLDRLDHLTPSTPCHGLLDRWAREQLRQQRQTGTTRLRAMRRVLPSAPVHVRSRFRQWQTWLDRATAGPPGKAQTRRPRSKLPSALATPLGGPTNQPQMMRAINFRAGRGSNAFHPLAWPKGGVASLRRTPGLWQFFPAGQARPPPTPRTRRSNEPGQGRVRTGRGSGGTHCAPFCLSPQRQKNLFHFKLNCDQGFPYGQCVASISKHLTPASSAEPGVTRGEGRDAEVVAIEASVVDFFVDAAALLGVPKSVAVIYGIVFASPQPLSFADIEHRITLSKGSISQGLRLLREVGAIKEVSTPIDRAELFTPDLEMRLLIQRFLEQRLEKQLDGGKIRLTALQRALPRLGRAEADTLRSRLKQLQQWHDKARSVLPVVRTLLKLAPG